MKRNKQRLLAVLLSLIMSLSLMACADEEDVLVEDMQGTEITERSKVQTEDGSWAVYWYLCGSDLETNGGFATTDLEEMLQVDLPENVKFHWYLCNS